MSIGKKLVIAGISVSATLGIVLFALALWQGNTTRTIAAQEVREQSRNGLEHVVAGIAAMVNSQREVLEQKAAADLNVAQHLLQQTGPVSFDREQMVEWQAVNQITKDGQTVRLPRMLCGETWLGQNADMTRPSPVVDRLKELVGGTATIFQRMNDAGDMLRVVTNVETLENKRAISTYIPAVTPDGTPNPVLAKVLSGERFVGRAFVVNRWYVTAYEPIRVEGRVAGALFVGVPEDSAVSLRRQIMDIVVGETGYVYVLDPKGNYVISHQGQRDGENVWEAKDADGKLFIQDAVTRAMALKSGEFCEISYPWKNQGDAAPRNKTVTLAYYEPWQWVIGAGTWDEEFMKGEMLIHDANARASRIMIGLVLVMLSAAAVVWLFIARSITRPIVRTADMLKDISEGEGDLTKRLAVTSNDEVGRLARHFNHFVEKLQGLIGQIADSVNLVASSSTELAATAAQLASGAEETTNQSAQVAAAAEQMSTNMTNMSASTDQVSTRVRTVSAAVEQVTASIGEMAKSAERAASAAASATQLVESSHTQITELGTAADQIGKVIEVIQDIAEQTNLLALNATIEAARAGDAGRGFAVVATEVKELAKQTAGATEDIRRRIEGIQSSTGLAVSSMGGIGEVIRQVNELSRTIASAVEEQSIATREIAGNIAESSTAAEAVAKGVAESSVASQEIARIVVGVDQAARQSSLGATQTQSTGHELSTVAEQLRALVGQFKI